MSAFFLFSIIAIGFAAGCCLPDQHEALAVGFDKPRNATFFETISYDYTNERLRVDRFVDYRTVHQRHESTFFLLKDWKSNQLKEYIYFRDNNTCTAKAHPEPFKKSCVKANHHRKFDFTLGLGYRCVFYEYTTKTEVFNTVVSKEHCAPISGTFFDHHNSGRLGFQLQISFYDVHLGIANPIVFELPAACDKA